jgi:LysR family transcriptional regulator, nitrogen assimilation regulatory protein
MHLKQLQVFATVANAGTLSKAAVALSITQPVVTRQIRALEDELGVELFYRNGRGMVLTDGGRLLLQHAEEIIASLAKAKSEVSAMRSMPSGKYAIGVPPSVGTVLTVPLVQKIKSEFPQISLKIIEGFSGHVLEWLANGRIDIAVLYGESKHQSFLTEPLLEDELFLLGPANDPHGLGNGPVELAELERVPMILPSRPHGLRVLLDTVFEREGVTPKIEMELEAMPSALLLAEEGVGYTVLPYAAVYQLVQNGRIACWALSPKITRTLILATSTQRPMTAVLRTLIRIVRAEVRDLPVPSVAQLSGVRSSLTRPSRSE